MKVEKFNSQNLKKLLKSEWGLFGILLVLSIVFTFLTDSFATLNNLMNITRQVSIVLIIAIGMLCVVLNGEIDLSVGSAAALAGVACAIILKSTGSITYSIIFTLVLSIILGLTNGALTVFGKIPSFIVTLSTMWIFRGIALVWTQGRAVSGLPRAFSFLGAGHIGIVPVSTILCAVLIFLAFYFIHKTKHGVYLRSIGANEEASKLSAIPIKKYKMFSFILAGVMSGIGGIITTSKLLSAQAIASEGMEMDVLAAVILGGASLSGGVGTVIGTVLGALIIGVINNGMNQLGISAFYQQIVKGLIIIIAVLIRRNKK
ncbi:MAG: ABC transporter permease [Pleomorphochaeta sp.]